jgi:F-type H+-transporting ATPase subunit a
MLTTSLPFAARMVFKLMSDSGLIPYNFTVTTHIIITSTLALSVFLTVLVYGFWKHGLHFFNLFVPKGIPIYILPLVVFIELLSFLSRPISHSVRLFANMLAQELAQKKRDR